MLIKNIKTRKADITVEKILGVVLAVLCLVILIFLAVKLYNALVEGNTLEQAEATLSTITGIITGLKDTESRSYILTAPEGWYFVLYSLGDKRPERCADAESCLCLCPRDNLLKNKELQSIEWGISADVHKRIEQIKNRFYEKGIIEKCSTSGLCQTLPKNIKMNSYFTQPSGYSSFKARQVVFTKNWVSMLWLKSIYIEQKDGAVIITEEGSPESNKFLDNLLKEEFKIPELGDYKFTLAWWVSDAFNHCSYTNDNEIKGEKDVQEGIKEYLKSKGIGGWVYVFAVDDYGVIATGSGKTTFDTSASNKLYDNSKKAIEKICDNQFKVYVIYVPEKQ